MDYVPSIYSDLAEEEWRVMQSWYGETDSSGHIGECAVPLMSLLQGLVMGNGIDRIVQLGTCSGYSALLLGFMLRRMSATNGLFSVDIGAELCAISRRWIARAGLESFVEIAQRDSTDRETVSAATDFLRGAPDLVIVDSSHESGATLSELYLWYPALAPGGIVVLHDVSHFAEGFDVTAEGGVRRACEQWRRENPSAESIILNGEARSMEAARALYKDACGVALLHKPGLPAAG